MEQQHFTFQDPQGYQIFVYKWLPLPQVKIRGIVQIAHGIAETAARYERFASELVAAGYIIYANDHRGHGRSLLNEMELGYAGTDGFEWLVKNMYQLTQIITKEHPGLPIYLFGHSMGSFLAQKYLFTYGNELNGAIICATGGNLSLSSYYGKFLAKLKMITAGVKSPATLLNHQIFTRYNHYFKPNRTKFDWLSRDAIEVDKYSSNPYCGFVPTAQFYYDFFTALTNLYHKKNLMSVPKNLPLFFIAGSEDPVGNFAKGVTWVIKNYQKAGCNNLQSKFYPNARHELLNETNRDEATQDILSWLDQH